MKQKSIYLIAYYSVKPKNPRKTYEAGYMKDPNNISYDEKIEISKGLKSKAQLTSKIILDLTNKKIVQNSFNHNTDFNSMFKYFYEAYSKYISTIMMQIDPTFMVEFAKSDLAENKVELTENQIEMLSNQSLNDSTPESTTISG